MTGRRDDHVNRELVGDMGTQKVRIKLLINEVGEYTGYGWKDAKSSEINDTIYDAVEGRILKEYWLEAEVPIPSAAIETLQANVATVGE